MRHNFLQLCERSFTGPSMPKADWDMKIVRNVRQKVKQHDLKWSPDQLITDDSGLITRLWQAALEFVCETGIYNMSTERVIELSRQEIETGLAAMPKILKVGAGKQSRHMEARLIEDNRRPFFSAGNPGCPTPEELFLPITRSLVQEPLIDMVNSGSLTTVDGISVRGGEASEVLAVQKEQQLLNLAKTLCGRPGMPTLGAESSVTEIGDLCVARSGSLDAHDVHLVSMFNEMIMDRGNLVRAANSLEYGITNASLACTMVGGLAGDAPGAAMVMIASMMAANLVCLADFHLCHPIHIKHVATTSAACLWVQSAVCQAFAQNAPAIIMGDIWPKSGAMTKELLYEMAANTLVLTVCGGHSQGAGAVDGKEPHGTGLESRLMAEVGISAASSGLDRRSANEMVGQLVKKYEAIFERPEGNPGLPFDQTYDPVAIQPRPQWLAMYEEVKEELKTLGLKLD